MAASTFDTLAAARALEAAGVDRKQAEARAEQLRAAAGADLESLATKADLAVITAKLGILQWVMAFQAALILAIAGRLFGIV